MMSWPPTLTPSTITMELVVASSRGRNIGDHLHNPLLHIPIRTHFKKSASFNTLTNMASSIIQPFINNVCPSQPIHVYFLAGLDLEHHLLWPLQGLEIPGGGVWETAQEACNRVVADIEEAESTVLGLGAIPRFCTVAPMSFRAWNTTGLHQRKTTHLKHSQHYLGPSSEHPDYTQNTQVELENATTLINQKNLQNQRKQWNVYTQNSWTNL